MLSFNLYYYRVWSHICTFLNIVPCSSKTKEGDRTYAWYCAATSFCVSVTSSSLAPHLCRNSFKASVIPAVMSDLCPSIQYVSPFFFSQKASALMLYLQFKALTVTEVTVLESFWKTINFCLNFEFHLVLESPLWKGKAKEISEFRSYVVWALSLVLTMPGVWLGWHCLGEVFKVAISLSI